MRPATDRILTLPPQSSFGGRGRRRNKNRKYSSSSSTPTPPSRGRRESGVTEKVETIRSDTRGVPVHPGRKTYHRIHHGPIPRGEGDVDMKWAGPRGVGGDRATAGRTVARSVAIHLQHD